MTWICKDKSRPSVNFFTLRILAIVWFHSNFKIVLWKSCNDDRSSFVLFPQTPFQQSTCPFSSSSLAFNFLVSQPFLSHSDPEAPFRLLFSRLKCYLSIDALSSPPDSLPTHDGRYTRLLSNIHPSAGACFQHRLATVSFSCLCFLR